MYQSFMWAITIPSFLAVIQSTLWTGLAVAGALVYLGVIAVNPYKSPSDFFWVTWVKLYFEGPLCTPNGDYLGQFNKDYKNLEKFPRFLTQDLIFAVLVSYIILNIMYFFTSLSFYKSRKVQSDTDKEKLLTIVKGWSTLSLIISFLDILLTASLISDVIALMKYQDNLKEHEELSKLAGITYIPIVFALVSSRFVAVWLWNVIVGGIIFINAYCMDEICGLPSVMEAEPEEKQEPEEEQEPEETSPKNPSISELKSDWEPYPYSLEGVTNFRDYYPEIIPPCKERRYHQEENERKRYYLQGDQNRERHYLQKNNDRKSYYEQKKPSWYPPYPGYGRRHEDWGNMNEGYVSEEQGPNDIEKSPDFDHTLKNFEQGQKKIKIVKPPLGKPVSIPVPPPLPQNEAYNC